MHFFKNLFREFKIKKNLSIFGVLIIGALNAAEQAPQDTALIAATQEMSISIPRGLPDPLAFNPDQPFERVITLGWWCSTKGAVNYYFNPESPIAKTKKGHADLFDWLFIHDYKKFALALENNLSDFFEKDDFDWDCLTNRKYAMHWNHLFDSWHDTGYFKQEFGIEGFDFPQGFIASKIDNIFPFVREKIMYLRQKFIDAQQFKTLYVISDPRRNNIDEDTLIALRNGLLKIRNGNANFTILYLHSYDFEIKGSLGFNIRTSKLIHVLDKKWDGKNINPQDANQLDSDWLNIDNQRWKEILDQFKFAPDIWD
ncbi:MAG: hypothetical protein NEHIOOID_00524 [Holosporales bacterium]